MKLLTTSEVAEILGQTPKNVQHLVRTGKLKRVNPQCYSNFLFQKKDVDSYLQNKSYKHQLNADISTKNKIQNESSNY